MFDPTAFENMKVVIEGAIYDRDLDGEILVIDRNDLVNLAKISRIYEVTFALSGKHSVTCTFRLKAELENLAAELLPSVFSRPKAGAHAEICFSLEHADIPFVHQWIDGEIKKIWGEDRDYEQIVRYDPFLDKKLIKKEINLSFQRLIYEDQMDDIEEMIDHMLLTLERLEEFLQHNDINS